MFDNIKNILNKFEKALNDLNFGFNDDDEGVRGYKNAEDTIDYFDLYIAEAQMKDRYINAKKVAKIILATKEERNELP